MGILNRIFKRAASVNSPQSVEARQEAVGRTIQSVTAEALPPPHKARTIISS